MAELLVTRGARINATNRGDDTPLHLASAHGHKEIVQLVMKRFNNIVLFNSPSTVSRISEILLLNSKIREIFLKTSLKNYLITS